MSGVESTIIEVKIFCKTAVYAKSLMNSSHVVYDKYETVVSWKISCFQLFAALCRTKNVLVPEARIYTCLVACLIY